ncbi:MAG: hypothetical protein ABMB14_08020 [Myxococcota bacterium]
MSEREVHRALAACAPPAVILEEDLAVEVIRAYGSPGRHYHTVDHVVNVAREYAAVASGPGWRRPVDVFAAVLAHDAVYDVARTDNEARSADLGREWAARLGADADRTAALVLATATHVGGGAIDDDPDTALFLDCDLAILGAAPDVYDAYEAAIAREYAPVAPEPMFRAGRGAFLAKLLACPTPFHTAWFTARYGAAARSNLERAARALAP